MISNSAFKERFGHVSDGFIDMVSLFRQYPDYLLDYAKTENTMYELTPFQRVYLRAFLRYKFVGIVASRGLSKTFVNILANYIKCILYPNNHLCIAMPTKEQSAKVVKEKIEEYWRDYPLLLNELKYEKCKFEKDYVKLVFKNGSTLDTLTVGASSRGLRAQGLSLEEIVDERMDSKTINEVLLPILAQARTVPGYGVDKNNEYSKTQAYVTTASHRQSYCFEKFNKLYSDMVAGLPAIVLGTSYEMGTDFGTLDIEDVIDKQNDATYSPLSFDREYRSIFTGASEGSLVNSEHLNKTRTLKEPIFKANKADKNNPNVEFVLSYDVARANGKANANSALVVIRIEDRGDGTYIKHLVNIFTMEGIHFEQQAKFLKQKVKDFSATILCIDINGMGWGLVDYLTSEIDDNPPYSIVNNDDYDKYKKANSIPMIFAINSSSKKTKNSNIINHFKSFIYNNDVKLLAPEGVAKNNMLELDGRSNAEKILPFVQTDRLVDEIMNLEYVNNGNSGTVKQVSHKIQKDRFSAFSYGLYWILLKEIKNKNKRQATEIPSKNFAKFKKPKYKRFT